MITITKKSIDTSVKKIIFTQWQLTGKVGSELDSRSKADLGNVRPACHIRPAKHLKMARELRLKFSNGVIFVARLNIPKVDSKKYYLRS